MKLTSYLIFNRKAEEAAAFYADLLGGKIENLHRYESMPVGEGFPVVPEDCKQLILHACIGFPGGSLSLADNLPNVECTFSGVVALNLHCDSISHIEMLYDKLSVGAKKIQYELTEAYFAKRYAEVVDRFGILWMLMYEEN